MTIPYLEFFGLREEPYTTTPSPRYLYVSPTHSLALEKTKWTIVARRGLAICFGQPGTGKTTLIRELAARIEDDPAVSYVFITNPNFPTPNQLLRTINQEFKVPQTSKNYQELLRIFKDFLAEQTLSQNKNLVLLIDEAQTLKPPLLELLRQLMNYETNEKKFLQVVLFAQEEFRARLAHPRFRNLVTRAAMASTLEALSPTESTAMLKHRWWIAANGNDTFPFTDTALDQLYSYSKGIPRTQIIIADNALLSAFLTKQKHIQADLIHAVVKDRGLPDTEPEPEQRTIKTHLKKELATAP